MQTITDKKSLALTNKAEITDLVEKAKKTIRDMVNLEGEFLRTRDFLMLRGWILGSHLAELKQRIPHGDWEKWLPANFSELGGTDRYRLEVAKRSIKLFRDNQSPHLLRFKSHGIPCDLGQSRKLFNCDSERKFMWRYIPEKQRPQIDDDKKFPRSVSLLNIANEYNRLRHRHINGLQLVDFEEAKEETGELLQFLKWLHGESPHNPWES